MIGRRGRPRAGTILAALYIIVAIAIPAWADKRCAVYTRKTCLYHANITTAGARCSPMPCNFDQRTEFECGFSETGSFSYVPEPEYGCEDPFMSMRRAPETPCGPGGRCCDAGALDSGAFSVRGAVPRTTTAARYVFQPLEADCQFEPVTRGEVMALLHELDAPLAVSGDSMMRQFFLRLVMMMRGQTRLLDHHIHTHSQYSVCHEGDAFRVAQPTADGVTGGSAVFDHLLEIVPQFFFENEGPGAKAARRALSDCTHRPRQLHFIQAPQWSRQTAILPVYVDSLPAGVKPILVVAVGYWEKAVKVPDHYLNTLLEMARHVKRLVVVSVPTAKTPRMNGNGTTASTQPSQYEIISGRNAFMKNWVAEQRATHRHGKKFMFLDLAAISEADNRPPLPGGTDKHYICSIWWRPRSSGGKPVIISTEDGPQFAQGSVERIQTSEDGSCTDETQRNAWMVLLNALLES